MKYTPLLSLLFSSELISAFVAPQITKKVAAPSCCSSLARFLVTDYQARRHADELVHRFDDVILDDGYARPDRNSISSEATSREWMTRKMNPRRVLPNVLVRRNYEGRNRFGSNAYVSLADPYERDLEEDMDYYDLEMMERDMYDRDLTLLYGGHYMDDYHFRDDITMQVLLDMDLHYAIPANVDSRFFDDLSPRERLLHPEVFVMEGNLLRTKQIPENVYLIELLQHDLEEYMETILY